MRRLSAVALVLALLSTFSIALALPATAAPGCQQVLVVFARGSGQTLDGDKRSKEADIFYDKIRASIASDISVSRVDLGNLDGDNKVEDKEYPAVPFLSWFGIDLKDYFDPDEDAALEGYNRSRKTGTDELVKFLNDRNCPDETVVLGGYSQGADAIGAALPKLSDRTTGRIGYIALFGDPKFWPGSVPSRLFGHKAPWARGDFQWYHEEGFLGGRDPYVPEKLAAKTGSWCDKLDGICTGNPLRLPVPIVSTAHFEYAQSEVLQGANEAVTALQLARPELKGKISPIPLPISLRPTEKVDVAFVIDSTGSMEDDIEAAKASIGQVADKVFGIAKSPRVMLIDYKDVGDAYQSRVDVPFTDNRSSFTAAVNELTVSGGGDTPESVYSGLMTAYAQDWRPGALKLTILIGDAPAKNPDPVTGYTLDKVLTTAKNLDPVVINPILVGNDAAARSSFDSLAAGSKGQMFTSATASDLVKAIDSAITGFSMAPVAQAGGPYSAGINEEISFTGAGSYDPDGAITKYGWDFNNDGKIDETSSSPVVTHKYGKSYVGLVALTVTGSDGRENVATAEVTVDSTHHVPRVPSPPRTVVASVISPGSIAMKWEPPASQGDGPVGAYRIVRSDGLQLAIVAADARSFLVEGVPTGQNVQFAVRAVNEFGNSDAASSNVIGMTGRGGLLKSGGGRLPRQTWHRTKVFVGWTCCYQP